MDLSDEVCKDSIVSHCSRFYEKDSTACIEYLDLFVDCEYHAIELSTQEAFHEAITRGRDGKGVVFGMFNVGPRMIRLPDVCSPNWLYSAL